MAKKFKAGIGDVFSIEINSKEKRYIQLVAFDLLQLNSDVIRCFDKIYPLEFNPNLDAIVSDEVLFYAHCAADFGLKLKVWDKVGNISDVGNPGAILFRSSDDYARKLGQEPIKISHDWYIWRITDRKFTRVGKLEKENRKAFVGLVFNPYGILELAKGNEYPVKLP